MSGCLNIFLRSIDIFVEKLEMARKGSLLKSREIASEIQINHALFLFFSEIRYY